MKTFRNDKNTTEHYTSFEDLASAFGKKPFKKQTKDAKKLKSQRKRFLDNHRCRLCHKPMTFVGGNQMVCENPNCIRILKKHDNFGNLIEERRISPYQLLDSKSAEIAQNIFT